VKKQILKKIFFLKKLKLDYSKDRVVYPKDDKKFLGKLQHFYNQMTKTTEYSGGRRIIIAKITKMKMQNENKK